MWDGLSYIYERQPLGLPQGAYRPSPISYQRRGGREEERKGERGKGKRKKGEGLSIYKGGPRKICMKDGCLGGAASAAWLPGAAWLPAGGGGAGSPQPAPRGGAARPGPRPKGTCAGGLARAGFFWRGSHLNNPISHLIRGPFPTKTSVEVEICSYHKPFLRYTDLMNHLELRLVWQFF